MSTIKTIEADLLARDIRVAIVASRFNDFVVARLVDGAVDAPGDVDPQEGESRVGDGVDQAADQLAGIAA